MRFSPLTILCLPQQPRLGGVPPSPLRTHSTACDRPCLRWQLRCWQTCDQLRKAVGALTPDRSTCDRPAAKGSVSRAGNRSLPRISLRQKLLFSVPTLIRPSVLDTCLSPLKSQCLAYIERRPEDSRITRQREKNLFSFAHCSTVY